MFEVDEASLPRVVFVGNYGAGKSTFIKVLTGQREIGDLENEAKEHDSDDGIDELMAPMILTFEADADSSSSEFADRRLCIIDTLARDVEGTKARMAFADMVVIVVNASTESWTGVLRDYWIPLLRDASVQRPVVVCFNQIDRVAPDELEILKENFRKMRKLPEFFIVGRSSYMSAVTGVGLDTTRRMLFKVLKKYSDSPRWALIDPYSMKLKPNFEAAIARVFRLLDTDRDGLLDHIAMEYFNSQILGDELSERNFEKLLEQLSMKNERYAETLGVTQAGFRHILESFVNGKDFERCWRVLRHYYYQNDLTLHPRVFPDVGTVLPKLREDQTIELTAAGYTLLTDIFNMFAAQMNTFMADSTQIDKSDDDDYDYDLQSDYGTVVENDSADGSGSVERYSESTASRKSHGKDEATDDTMQVPERTHKHNQTLIGKLEGFGDSSTSAIYEVSVFTKKRLRKVLSVLPLGRASLHCSLLDSGVMSHFETIGALCDKLTVNGWLSYWAMLSVESPLRCAMQLTYLDMRDDSERGAWFRVTASKADDRVSDKMDRTVIRVLLFGGPRCGKTVFSERLISRIPRFGRQRMHNPTVQHKSVANRLSQAEGFLFMAVTEVPAKAEMVTYAIKQYLPYYDMILLMYGVNQSRSFYDLHKIFEAMPGGHGLPVQVIGSMADAKSVRQYNQDNDDERYDVEATIEELGLKPRIEASITPNVENAWDFESTVHDLAFIAQNPIYGRIEGDEVVVEESDEESEGIGLKTVIKRTITLTCAISLLMFSGYKIYSYFRPIPQRKGARKAVR